MTDTKIDTYNKYVTEEAQKQSNNGPMTVYMVRKPKKGEQVVGYENLSDGFVTETVTELAEREGAEDERRS